MLRPTTLAADVDVLDFILGDASLWPRHGDQQQHQAVDRERQIVCWVKYGRAEMYDCWRWDDDWIYHVVDAALDGDSGSFDRIGGPAVAPAFTCSHG